MVTVSRPAERTTVVVIGAGHAGLAASHFLSAHSIDHIVLERGEVANSWRRERWDSLRLLTPNQQSRLPGHRYEGPDPDGYMTMPEVIAFIERFAELTRAPIRTGTTVTTVRRTDDGYQVSTTPTADITPTPAPTPATTIATSTPAPTPTGATPSPTPTPVIPTTHEIHCRAVVIASGACNLPSVPNFANALPPSITQLTPFDYTTPADLPGGGVLVVGASATGVQLAAEIHRSGRPVTLSVGEHVRLPRAYRGRDILWWMEASGVWDQRHDELDDLTRARKLPSPQLVGTPERATLDLNTLTDMGVEPVGRWAMLRDGRALFSGGLRNVFSLADLKLERLLDAFDDWAATHDTHAPDAAHTPQATDATHTLDVPHAPERFAPTRVPEKPRLQLDLTTGEIQTVIWATGFRPDYSWLDVPVVDAKGHLCHEGGVVVDSPGLYALGLPVLRRRKSTFIHGIEDDARDVIDHLAAYLAGHPNHVPIPRMTASSA